MEGGTEVEDRAPGAIGRVEGQIPDAVVRGLVEVGGTGQAHQLDGQAGDFADTTGKVDRHALRLGPTLGDHAPYGGLGQTHGQSNADGAGGARTSNMYLPIASARRTAVLGLPHRFG